MRLRLTIEGMISVHAKRAVFTALAGVSGVKSAEVELGSAVVECDASVREDDVRVAIESVGCHVSTIRRELPTA